MELNKEKKLTELDEKVERSLRGLSVEEKLSVYKGGVMLDEYCSKVVTERMSQEALLGVEPAMWRGIRRGQNVSIGTILHVDQMIKKELSPQEGGKMLFHQILLWTTDTEQLKVMNKCLSEYLKDK